MSAKEQLLNMLDFIGENEARLILHYAEETLTVRAKTWDDIEEDEPLPDEIKAFNEYLSSKKQIN